MRKLLTALLLAPVILAGCTSFTGDKDGDTDTNNANGVDTDVPAVTAPTTLPAIPAPAPVAPAPVPTEPVAQ